MLEDPYDIKREFITRDIWIDGYTCKILKMHSPSLPGYFKRSFYFTRVRQIFSVMHDKDMEGEGKRGRCLLWKLPRCVTTYLAHRDDNEMKTVNEIGKPDENYHLVKRKPLPSPRDSPWSIQFLKRKRERRRFCKISSKFSSTWIRRIIIWEKLSRG